MIVLKSNAFAKKFRIETQLAHARPLESKGEHSSHADFHVSVNGFAYFPEHYTENY
jgi:hypothetical protein